MSSIVEQARALHEDNELIKRRAVNDFVQKRPKTHRGDILQQHRLRRCLEQIRVNNESLKRIYDDVGGTFREELQSIHSENVFTTFYDQLKQLRESHSRAPLAAPTSNPYYAGFEGVGGEPEPKQTNDNGENELPDVRFTGEEKFGKYVDMSELHDRFVNLPIFKGLKRMDYGDYLTMLSERGAISRYIGPHVSGNTTAMRSCLQATLDYLANFHSRIHPLYPIDKVMMQIEEEFKQRQSEEKPVMNKYFCVPCQKQFSKDSVLEAHRKSKKHMRKEQEHANRSSDASLAIPLLQFKVEVFAELLSDVIHATRQRAEAQLTRTYEEIRAERNEYSEEESESDNDSEEDTVLYNPKNVPL